MQESFSSGVGVGLEDTPQSLMREIGGCSQGGRNLCGMVGVIVHDGNSANGTLVFEASVGTVEGTKGFGCCVQIQLQVISQSQNGQGVAHIVQTGNCKMHFARMTVQAVLFFHTQGKERMPLFIVGELIGIIISLLADGSGSFGRISDDAAGKSGSDFIVIGNLSVDDKTAILRNQLGKLTERVSDLCQVFKEVKVVFLYIKNNADIWFKALETVGVFTSLGYKQVCMAHTDVAADGL